MVALHVDGYDTVGALRAVVAWANGVDVKGSSTWDVGRSCAFDEEALALHAEAWHAAMPAFQVWGWTPPNGRTAACCLWTPWAP